MQGHAEQESGTPTMTNLSKDEVQDWEHDST